MTTARRLAAAVAKAALGLLFVAAGLAIVVRLPPGALRTPLAGDVNGLRLFVFGSVLAVVGASLLWNVLRRSRLARDLPLVRRESGVVPANGGVVRKAAVRPGIELICPTCTSRRVVPLVYGVPSPLLHPLFLERKIFPGGGMGRLLNGQAPTWKCLRCDTEWRGGLFAGGPGDSMERAVVIRGIESTAVGIRVEKQYLTEQFGLSAETTAPQPGWTFEGQRVFYLSDRKIDVLDITLPDGSRRSVFFDITCFYGKVP